MGYTVVAIALGVIAGLAAGGRPANAARHTLRWWPALVAGAAAQALPELLGMHEALRLVAVLASYAALTAFAVANLRLVGMPVVLLGLALNLTVIAVNGGMPVRESAILAAGIVASPEEVRGIDFGAKRHLEHGGDQLTILGDIVPVPPLREVLSFGDLILAAGVADVVFRVLRPVRARRRALAPGVATISHQDQPEPSRWFATTDVVDLAGEERHLVSSRGV